MHESAELRLARRLLLASRMRSDAQPRCAALFLAFLEIAACSFGGAAAWARRILVEKRRWLSDAEFTELFGLGQILPGPNVANVACCLGHRWRGIPGALSAVAGLMVPSTAIAIGIDLAISRWLHAPAVSGALSAIAAAAGGLLVATALKMAARWRTARLQLLASVLAAAGLLAGFPLLVIVLLLGPVGVALGGVER